MAERWKEPNLLMEPHGWKMDRATAVDGITRLGGERGLTNNPCLLMEPRIQACLMNNVAEEEEEPAYLCWEKIA